MQPGPPDTRPPSRQGIGGPKMTKKFFKTVSREDPRSDETKHKNTGVFASSGKNGHFGNAKVAPEASHTDKRTIS